MTVMAAFTSPTSAAGGPLRSVDHAAPGCEEGGPLPAPVRERKWAPEAALYPLAPFGERVERTIVVSPP
jgi:hypothetical protein